MNFFTSIVTKYKNWETFTTSHHNIDAIILGMETLGKTQDGKPMQQSDMNFIIEKIWNFYNQQNIRPT